MKKLKLRMHQFMVIIKYFLVCLLCKIIKFDNKDIWLISERGDEARDNGYAFFKYMEKNHSDINFKYIINKKSSDIARFKNKERLIYQGSFKHYIYFKTAGYLLSTHIMGYSPEFRIFYKLDKWGFVKLAGKRIYLNHGIEQNNVDGLKFGSIKVDLFVCGGKKQYDYEVDELKHPEGVVQYTGLPRYDYLNNNIKKQILLMPTWRSNLFYCKNIDEFKKSDYFIMMDKLLRNNELIEFLKENDYNLIFYPHYEIQPYIKAFKNYDLKIKIADFDHYDVQTLINESKLMITDYSSVMFDFAYLDKPIIYYQFDFEDFMKNHYGKGYFDYKKDGFGYVVDTPNKVVEKIKNYKKNNFEMENEFVNNKKEFFVYCDKNNCERVYNAIINCKKNY